LSWKILEKCEGWPLAIVAIASLLAKKPTKTEDQWYSVYNSISTGLENNHGVKDMRLILSLSYRDMPSQLRPCLLYLSLFPEDHIIGRDELIRRWIAEDLVHGKQDDGLYELGDKYFNELVNRSMIQPINVDAFGKAQACKVHDLVLEFVTFLSTEEDFVTIFNGQHRFPSQLDSIHRLSLRNSKGEHVISWATNRLPHVRTLVVSSGAIDSMPSLSIFPVLRVLEIEQCTSSDIRGVENLVHLRYLRLSQKYHYYNIGIELPKGIGKLQFLQTLDLKEARIKELPSTVVQFRHLRVVEILLGKCDKRFEKHLLQCLRNLKRLEAFGIIAPDISVDSFGIIGPKLSLDFMLQLDWAPKYLQRFTASPRERTIHILRRRSVWPELSPFSRLPGWLNSSLSCLSDLCIKVRTLRQVDVEILADIPVLRSVNLEVVEATGTRLEINGSVAGTGHAFRCLGNLKFASRAVGLAFKPGSMQKLQKIYLCFDVAETKDVHGDFNLGLEYLTSLATVNVDIDCRCARLWEIEAAEAALRNATKLNPNCPTLDLERHLEGLHVVPDQEEIPQDLQGKKEEDALLSRVGPFGGNGGRAQDIQVPPHRLKSVTICSDNIARSLAFSYTDHNGQQHSTGPWGNSTSNVSTIHLGPSEHLIKVSGTVGPYFAVHNLITSLTFVTNAASYGPFGKPRGVPFVLPVQSNSSIVGFFGRSGQSLDAIGFYVRSL